MKAEEIKKDSKAAKPSGEWINAFISGLVAGAAFLFARTKLEGASSLAHSGNSHDFLYYKQ